MHHLPTYPYSIKSKNYGEKNSYLNIRYSNKKSYSKFILEKIFILALILGAVYQVLKIILP